MDRSRVLRRVLVAAVAGLLAAALGLSLPARPAAAQSTLAADLLAKVNNDRASAGLGPVAWSDQLAAVGQSQPYGGCGFTVEGRAADMLQRNYFAHPILDCGGQTVFDMLRAAGVAYSVAGENIGWEANGGDPASEAAWLNAQFMSSPEHRANILDASFTSLGIGVWSTAPGQAWTGAGSPQQNVVMVTEEFAALRGVPAAPAPRRAALSRSAQVVHATVAAPAPPSPGLPDTGVAGQLAPAGSPPQTGAFAAPAAATGVPPPSRSPALPLGGAGVLLGGVAVRRFRPRG